MAVSVELDTWPEAHFRRREWIRPAEAMERLAEADLRDLLEALPIRLAGAKP